MTVQEFVEDYKKDLERIEILNYIPFRNKLDICNAILKDTCYEDGKLVLHSPIRNVMYLVVLVDVYTDIKVDIEHYIDEYDLLNQEYEEKESPLSWILGEINSNELREFDSIMQQLLADIGFNKEK